MKPVGNPWTRLLAAILVAVFSVTAAAAPCAAGAPAANPLPAVRTLAAAAEAHAASADPARALQAAPATTPTENGRPFFKTPRGILTGVLMAAGLGWVFYSKSHDRVRSPANQ